MSFGNPEILWLLPVLPPTVGLFLWWSWRQREALMARFISARLLPGLISGFSRPRQKLRLAALILAVTCLILALARPQWGFNWEEVKQRGLDIVVAIDTSKSMLAEDIAPNRLARAKLAALDLMRLAKADRLGLVAFAGDAFLQCPLTIDDAAFRQSVDALDVNIMPQGGTALAEAIKTALTAYKEGENFKVLVLLTDGEDHDSGALEAARKAAEAGLQIFTIGIGKPEGELLRIKKADGSSDYIRDEQGNVVKSHLNEDLLREMAGASTKGFYLRLAGAKTMESLFENGLAPLPKSDSRERLVKRYHDGYHWPLGLAILLLVAEMLLPERKRERRPVPRVVPPARPTVVRAATALVMLCSIGIMLGSPRSALRDYKSGNYEQSLKEYEQLLQRKSDDPRLQFNAGTAAFRNQQFDAAAKHFGKSLDSPDLKLQELGYYNRGNSLYWLGEQIPDPSKKTEAWEKSLKDFESSLKLNPQDPDARFNHEFVKKRLEELKQQQQQQQQNKPDQNQDQKQQDQQQQQKQQQDQQQAKQDQQDPQQNSSQGQPKEQQQQQQTQQQQAQQQQGEEQKQQPQPDKPSPDQKEQQQAKRSEGKDKEKTDQQGEAYAAGQMTPQQAQQLLDGEKSEEKLLQFKPDEKPQDRTKPVKDW
jgi:Ca-activated chloride channel homolog